MSSRITNKNFKSVIVSKHKFYIGVDVGGTAIKFGIFKNAACMGKAESRRGDALRAITNSRRNTKLLIDKFSVDTIIIKKDNEKHLLNLISGAIDNYCENNKYGVEKNKIAGIGFAMPGPVVNNQLLHAVNINWTHKCDIVKITKKKYGENVNVKVFNDANAACLGEYNNFYKDKYNSMCLITLGTGIGTGIIIDGKLVEGKTGIAGEVSHIRIDFSNKAIKCNCGNVGCIETLASCKGLVNIYKRLKSDNNEHEDDITLNDEKYKAIALSVINNLSMGEKLKSDLSDELNKRVCEKLDLSNFSFFKLQELMISELNKMYDEIIYNESIKKEVLKIIKNGRLEDVLTAKDIIDNAKNGDKISSEALNISLGYISDMIAILMHVYEPEVVVIGGGMSHAGTFITEIIEKHLKEKIFMTKTLPKIMIAKLKNDAGMTGAVVDL